MSIRIHSPDQSKTWSPPLFLVDSGPNPFWAVEVATAPELLNSRDHATERLALVNFYSSWESGLLTGSSFTLPDEAWTALRLSSRLYYRLHTSARAGSWQQHQTSTSDQNTANAPFVNLFDLFTTPDQPLDEARQQAIWHAAESADCLQQIRSAGRYEVVICQHRSSPKRPIPQGTAEWIVIASNQPTTPDAPIVTGVVRLDMATLFQKSQTSFTGPNASVNALGAARIMQENPPVTTHINWQVSAQALVKVGNLWLLSALAPSPTVNVGGTLIVNALSGQLIFSAATQWIA